MLASLQQHTPSLSIHYSVSFPALYLSDIILFNYLPPCLFSVLPPLPIPAHWMLVPLGTGIISIVLTTVSGFRTAPEM